MPKLLKRSIIITIGIFFIAFVSLSILRFQTKKHSPEETITHIGKDTDFKVFYNRPYKKERKIFGDLVPYDQVWRTGANEATTLTINKDIKVDGTILSAGTYTIWTIPRKDSWKVIFNSGHYYWGIDFYNGKPTHDPKYDVLTIEVPTIPVLNIVEQFSIYFEEANNFTIMYLSWEQTAIAIPISSP